MSPPTKKINKICLFIFIQKREREKKQQFTITDSQKEQQKTAIPHLSGQKSSRKIKKSNKLQQTLQRLKIQLSF